MKRIFLFSTLFLFYSYSNAELQYKELLHIPWGIGQTRAGLRSGPGGQFGPAAFRVINNNILILDSENQRLMIYESGKFYENVSLNLPFADDFFLLSQDHIIVLNENELFEVKDDLVQKIYSPPSPHIIITGLKNLSGQISASLSNQTSVFPVSGGLQKPPVENSIQIYKSSFSRAEIRINNTKKFNIESIQGNLGVVKHIGSTPSGNLYLYVENIRQHVPLMVDRSVQLFTLDGVLLSRIEIPLLKHSYIFREFDVDAKGNLYHMISSVKGIHIIAWYNDQQNTGPLNYIYPEKLRSLHHFNYLETNLPENVNLQKSEALSSITSLVTRNETLAIGDTYVKHIWAAEEKNLTNGRTTDPSGVEIETPSWVNVGQNLKIPYKWGGFWTIAGFDEGLLNGKYAGDIATSGVSSYCVGVDCSGFVSRCWKLSSHYSTRMMDDNITIAYDSWDKIQPADAVHKVGHVRLFVDFNTDGSLLIVESAGRDWRVSYHSYNYSELTAYTPRYYINMEGSPTLIAKPLLNHVLTTDSVRIAWHISDQSSISGFNLYLTLDGINWEYALADNTLQQESRGINLIKDSDLACYFKLTALAADDPSNESYSSDTYGYKYLPATPRILIVDGFDRVDGSYSAPYHEFAMGMGKTLEPNQVSFETIDNDDLLARSISLNEYDAVFWILGDESTDEETFSDPEQTVVKNYLKQGGKLFVSGSEIAWDLDYKGSASDKDFIHNYLCAAYYQDDSQSYTVHGVTGVFDNLMIQYDDGTHGIYEEDYPDAFNTSNNSQAILKYDNDKIAAVAKTGIFPGGSATGSVVLAGFPFETIYNELQQIEFSERILNYFGIIEASKDKEESKIVRDFVLYGNYPNPFNPGTTFHFTIPASGRVDITIFDMLGRKISTFSGENLAAGEHRITYEGSHLASGTYFYIIGWKDRQLRGKMKLIK